MASSVTAEASSGSANGLAGTPTGDRKSSNTAGSKVGTSSSFGPLSGHFEPRLLDISASLVEAASLRKCEKGGTSNPWYNSNVATNSPAYMRAYHKKHYAANKQYYLDKARRNQNRVRDLVRSAKNQPCADCKRRYPYYVMDFDHVASKLFEPNKLWQSTGFKRAQTELAKCEVVCSNCHRERTQQRLRPLSSTG